MAPGYRGQGLGRVLVRGLLTQAVRAGFRDVFMRVHPDNEKALNCYRGAGFVPADACGPTPANSRRTPVPSW
ncbi:GNAT family N-acetyltransferase [Streptomyces sp. NPDC004787]|uniref:GNAT family N-acetyltransferase n=1 Tax=Streptomyces sp. NPDC004787 TaxID=3154291 RepID=UPI0033A50EBC